MQDPAIVSALGEAEACLQWERSGTFEHRVLARVRSMRQYTSS